MKLFNTLLVAMPLVATVSCQAADTFYYGVDLHMGWYGSRGIRIQDSLRTKDFNSFRDEFSWNTMQKTETSTVLSVPTTHTLLKSAVSSSMNGKMTPLLILGLADQVSPEFPSTAQSRAKYIRYATYVMQQNPSVNLYELWNEWNIGGGLTGGRSSPYKSVEQYLSMASEAVPALRRVNPVAKFLSTGLGDRDNTWLVSMLKQGGANLFDGVALHPYNFNDASSKDTPEASASYVKKTAASIATEVGKSMPIYITEIGWPNHVGTGGSTPSRTARFLQRYALLVRAIPEVRGLWFYDYIDDGNDPMDKEQNFGLMTFGMTPKPALGAVNCLAKPIINGTNFSMLPAVDAFTGVAFSYGGSRYVALWNQNDQTTTVKVTAAAGTSSMKSHASPCSLTTGAALSTSTPATVTLTGAPVFVSVPDGVALPTIRAN